TTCRGVPRDPEERAEKQHAKEGADDAEVQIELAEQPRRQGRPGAEPALRPKGKGDNAGCRKRLVRPKPTRNGQGKKGKKGSSFLERKLIGDPIHQDGQHI